ISLHNIKNNFFYSKKFSNKFYAHFSEWPGENHDKKLRLPLRFIRKMNYQFAFRFSFTFLNLLKHR
ncbi:MAG: hypothetical protein C5B59_02670, partial [Bacteroidetes bacterium]